MSLETIDKEYIGQTLLSRGFRDWFLYMFRVVEGRPFIVEAIHEKLFETFDQIHKQKIIRSNLNEPPRSAKTTMGKYFVSYCITENPKCNFIYTSYSQELLSEISREIANILEHPVYKAMYPTKKFINEVSYEDPLNDFWKEYLLETSGQAKYTSRKIITHAGGVILLSAIGATITGFGCFPYDEMVKTDKGYKKIGDIVTNREEVNLYTYNEKTKEIEIKPVIDWITEKNKTIYEIKFNDGGSIKCTGDHQLFTTKGYKRADEISKSSVFPPNPFNNVNGRVKFFNKLFSAKVFIANYFNLFRRKICFIPSIIFSSLKSNAFSFFSPIYSRFNITYVSMIERIISGNFLIWSFIFCYFLSLFFCNFGVSVMSSVFYTVFLIVGLCAISKVFNTIIGRYTVKMSNNLKRFRKSIKTFYHNFVNKLSFRNSPVAESNIKISFFAFAWFKFVRFLNPFVVSYFHNPIKRFYSSFIRYYVKFFKPHYRFPVSIDVVSHCATSYCVTVKDNHNLFIGESQDFLVSNCGIRGAEYFSGALIIDDANKPADVRSELMRNKVFRYYEETLLNRLNNSNVAIINIQQRLHKEDLSGMLEKVYNYNTIKIPLIIDGVCQIPSQYTPERITELQKNNYTFQAQFQQEPVILGGSVIKTEWFKYYISSQDRSYRLVFMTGDTAQKVKEANDFTVFCVWGVTYYGKLQLIEMVRGKWEAPDLKREAINLWNRYREPIGGCYCSGFYIEDKSSGTALIQELKALGIPVIGLQRDKDKLTRVYGVTSYIEAGQVELPDNPEQNKDLLDECEAFTRDDSHAHDDIVDNIVDGITIGLAKLQVSILEVL